ncbi:hypothetical protein [Massilia sp. Dwa41.01b]|uniref:hypothetical protein n=1 Tax=Massilia sp. Dwa41.01b TaxID=2709302 RepID=UPI001E3C639E|nr:hypothetical protein [Massilia sp. Dwa41.01b]
MSYILEALKKAQAERQLGNAPDIHTPAPLQVATPAPGAKPQALTAGAGSGRAGGGRGRRVGLARAGTR